MNTIGLYGKFQGRGDFVRIGEPHPVMQDFEDWLHRSVSSLAARQLALPPDPIRFVFRGGRHPQCLVGVLIASADQVGREFPLAAFLGQSEDRSRDFPVCPIAYASFLAQAESLLAEASSLDMAGLSGLLQLLPVPEPTAVAAAWQRAQALLGQMPATSFVTDLLHDVSATDHAAALSLFVTGCRRHKGGSPTGPAAVLDCPVSADIELMFWLELARRLLQWPSGFPCVFWRRKDRRMLLPLGAPPPDLLAYLADPSIRSDQLWDVRRPATKASSAKPPGPGGVGSRRDMLGGVDNSTADLLAGLTGG